MKKHESGKQKGRFVSSVSFSSIGIRHHKMTSTLDLGSFPVGIHQIQRKETVRGSSNHEPFHVMISRSPSNPKLDVFRGVHQNELLCYYTCKKKPFVSFPRLFLFRHVGGSPPLAPPVLGYFVTLPNRTSDGAR